MSCPRFLVLQCARRLPRTHLIPGCQLHLTPCIGDLNSCSLFATYLLLPSSAQVCALFFQPDSQAASSIPSTVQTLAINVSTRLVVPAYQIPRFHPLDP